MQINSFENAIFKEADNKDVGIILLHAYTGSTADVNILANQLHREGYNVLAPLLPGHGTRDVYDILNTDVKEWFYETRRAIQFMESQNYDKLLIFGLSLGGILSTWALTQDEFSLDGGGVFNSPVLSTHRVDLDPPFTQYATYVYERNKASLNYELNMSDAIGKHYQQMNDLDKLKLEFEDDLERISKPFYIAQSGQDEMIDPDGVYGTMRALKKARINYNYFPENTHVITVNRNRQGFIDSLMIFIEAVLRYT